MVQLVNYEGQFPVNLDNVAFINKKSVGTPGRENFFITFYFGGNVKTEWSFYGNKAAFEEAWTLIEAYYETPQSKKPRPRKKKEDLSTVDETENSK